MFSLVDAVQRWEQIHALLFLESPLTLIHAVSAAISLDLATPSTPNETMKLVITPLSADDLDVISASYTEWSICFYPAPKPLVWPVLHSIVFGYHEDKLSEYYYYGILDEFDWHIQAIRNLDQLSIRPFAGILNATRKRLWEPSQCQEHDIHQGHILKTPITSPRKSSRLVSLRPLSAQHSFCAESDEQFCSYYTPTVAE